VQTQSVQLKEVFGAWRFTSPQVVEYTAQM
jgi:hypothetical protein